MDTGNIIAIAAIIITLIGVYTKLTNKIKELEMRVAYTEKQDDRIMAKLDSIAEDVNEIKIELKNKQDKQ